MAVNPGNLNKIDTNDCSYTTWFNTTYSSHVSFHAYEESCTFASFWTWRITRKCIWRSMNHNCKSSGLITYIRRQTHARRKRLPRASWRQGLPFIYIYIFKCRQTKDCRLQFWWELMHFISIGGTQMLLWFLAITFNF